MTLTLTLSGDARPEGGTPRELVLDRRGAVVGRAPGCDWALPDPTRHLSSRHFEIRFDGQQYLLTDCSTNGTMLGTSGQRISGSHVVRDGDRFLAGPYVIEARLSSQGAAPAASGWHGWGDTGGATPAASEAPAPSGWGPVPSTGGGGGGWQPQTGPSLARPEPHRAASSVWGDIPAAPASPPRGGWTPEAAAPPPPVVSAWDSAAPPADPASPWSSAAPDRPPTPSPNELWGRIAEGNVVDWARGGFGQPVERPRDPLGLNPEPQAALPPERPKPPAPPPAPTGAGDAAEFLRAAGLDPAQFPDPAEALRRAAPLLAKLVSGLVVMLEARARAKAQLGADATAFNPSGHNPLKFARRPEDALIALLSAPQPGFQAGDEAVEDAFRDLQSHQIATLRAMQGALKATVERFAPAAIEARAEKGGMLERVVPLARDAALWQAYVTSFSGVADASDEAFLEVFSKHFRTHYNQG